LARLHFQNDGIAVETRSTWLTALGAAGVCLTLACPATEATPADPILPDLAQVRSDHFRTPTDAVVAFLEAVQAKNAVRLRKATSIHAPNEAVPEHRALFRAIMEKTLSRAKLAALASELEGYEAIGPVRPSAGRITYLVMKLGPQGTQFVRTFSVRWHKQTGGWKVRDIGAPRPRETPLFAPLKRTW
jgi:hypothetical protein